MRKYKVKLFKKIIESREVIVEIDDGDEDDAADKAWETVVKEGIVNIEYEYYTKVEEV